jgi:hypothetical protein
VPPKLTISEQRRYLFFNDELPFCPAAQATQPGDGLVHLGPVSLRFIQHIQEANVHHGTLGILSLNVGNQCFCKRAPRVRGHAFTKPLAGSIKPGAHPR